MIRINPLVNIEGVDTNIFIESGRPQDQINHIGDKYAADMLILGMRGCRGMDKLVFGSVAEAVLRESHPPFLCVRG